MHCVTSGHLKYPGRRGPAAALGQSSPGPAPSHAVDSAPPSLGATALPKAATHQTASWDPVPSSLPWYVAFILVGSHWNMLLSICSRKGSQKAWEKRLCLWAVFMAGLIALCPFPAKHAEFSDNLKSFLFTSMWSFTLFSGSKKIAAGYKYFWYFSRFGSFSCWILDFPLSHGMPS